MTTAAVLALVLSIPTSGLAAANPEPRGSLELRASPQGFIRSSAQTSPRGMYWLTTTPVAADFERMEFAIGITAEDGSRYLIPRVAGSAFLVSDLGRIVAIDTRDSTVVPSRITVLDLRGRTLRELDVDVLTDPALSADGTHLAYRERGGVAVLNLRTLEVSTHPGFDLFAAGRNGELVGVRFGERDELALRDVRGRRAVFTLDERPRGVGFSGANSSVLVMTPRALSRLDPSSGGREILYTPPPGAELRDLRITPDAAHLGLRRIAGRRVAGALVTLDADGRFRSASGWQATSVGVSTLLPTHNTAGLPWPLLPNAQHPVGNTYGEFQDYGGSPYLHPGVDVLGSDNQPVYAVKDGVVKAKLTTSGDYHWRVAIGDSSGAAPTEGYLYAHLDRYSIAVNVGDAVVEGQYIGNLVPWPVYYFTHCHFARVEDSGNQWYGDWLCTENPHLDFENQTETTAPVFEPARGSDLLAFCRNQSSNYRNPGSLTGEVDIIAHVGDRISSSWVCTVQEIRYTIYPVGDPGSPVVDDKLAVFFDMELDTYQSGTIDAFLVDLLFKQDSICRTLGDYDYREFYHIITNSNGDQVYDSSDLSEAWDTTLIPDGDYVIEVTAVDVAGNATTESMTVTVDNLAP